MGPLLAAVAMVISVPAAASPLCASTPQDESSSANLFQLYNTQAARARAEKAEEHIAAGRWAEAIAELQTLIEEHEGEVLSGSRPKAAGARNPSQSDVHSGASSWAVAALFKLPEPARQIYRRRFESKAKNALGRAVSEGDRGALTRLARRWPLTDAAQGAWWALGDLELELGHAADGLRAWARAAAVALGEPTRRSETPEQWSALRSEIESAITSGAVSSGALARIDYALSVDGEVSADSDAHPADEASFVRGPASGVAAEFFQTKSIFSSRGRGSQDPSGWNVNYRLPDGPFKRGSGAGRLFPQRFRDTIFVNTSRSVHAIGAFDGHARWTLPAAALGWNDLPREEYNEFAEAVDVDERMVTVAASRGVVVAALQIPVAFQSADKFRNLDIIQVMPERRLVAMDTESGDVLWATMPPPNWDGESGSFSDRMTVVGPPTIVGARVLVPMARLRDRIELHLGCFDLTSGEVLWSNPIVTGQRELNMFGRALQEYSSPAPVVAGDKVILQTQLGLVAAVDLFTGETIWETLYEQVRVHPPEFYKAGWIENRWRNAAPIVIEDTIVATPQDGYHILALDLETGSMIWSLAQEELYRKMGLQANARQRYRRADRPVLVGADKERIFIGGLRVACFEFKRGVRQGPPYLRRWLWPLDGIVDVDSGYPVMDEKSVFVPNVRRLARLDKMTGLLEEELSGTIASGNVLVSDGMLFSTNGREVKAHFEWRAMVERARAACEAPDASASDVSGLVRLLLERAESINAGGRGLEGALTLAEEARAVLRRFGAEALPGPMATELHRAFMVSARSKRLLGQVEEARTLTLEALGLELGGAPQLESLLVLAEIERTRSKTAHATVLARLRTEFPDDEIMVAARLQPEPWSASGAFRDSLRASRENGVQKRDPWTNPWVGVPIPELAALAQPDPRSGRDPLEPPKVRARITGNLFARIGEVELARSSLSLEDRLTDELKALHAILEESPDEELFGTTSGLWAVSRIQSLRILHPDSSAIAALDAIADQRLTAAQESARQTGSTELLEALPRLFPGSKAARAAAASRVEYALANGSPEEIASIVVEALPGDWHPARSSSQQTEMLLRLAETLGGAGNTAFRAGLGESLARFNPDVRVGRPSDVPGTGEPTLREVADFWNEANQAAQPEHTSLPDFSADIVVTRRITGDFVHVGRGVLPGDQAGSEGSREIALFASAAEVLAIPTGSSGEPAWRRPIPLGISPSGRSTRVFVSGSSVVLATQDRVVCVDLATGEPRWRFSPDDRTIRSIHGDSGVCVIVTNGSNNVPAEVYGLDAVLGVELWYLNSIGQRYNAGLKVGSGRVVLLPLKNGAAAVHDIFTGYPISVIDTGRLSTRVAVAAWVDRGRLVLPFIESANSAEVPNAIVAYDLDAGSAAWRLDLNRFRGERRNLLGIVDMPDGEGGRRRLAMLQPLPDSSVNSRLRRTSSYALHCIDEDAGRFGTQPRLEIADSTRIMGVVIRQRVTLESPLLVVVSTSRTSSATILHGVSPDLATLWKVPAARKVLVPGAQNLPPAILSKGAVAMMVNEPLNAKNARSSETKLMLLDAETGLHLETRRLESPRLPPQGWRRMMAFGETLVVGGSKIIDVMEAPKTK